MRKTAYRLVQMAGVVATLITSSGLQSRADLIVETDASWKVSNAEPAPRWNVDVAFDESGFTPAVNNRPVGLPSGTVQGIWHPSGPDLVFFRRVVNLTEVPTAGTLDLGIDDDVQSFINGQLVLNDMNGMADGIYGIDVTSALRVGDNLIAARGANNPIFGTGLGLETLGARLSIRTVMVPEPSALVLAVVGALALLGYIRRAERPDRNPFRLELSRTHFLRVL